MDADRTARKTGGIGLSDGLPQPDMARMRHYRLGRLQEQLRGRAIAGALLFDSVSIRYATGSGFSQIFNFHIPFRCLFVPPEGKAILFGPPGRGETLTALGTIGEVRDMPTPAYFYAGDRSGERARELARQVKDLMGGEDRLAVDRMDPQTAAALLDTGLRIEDAQPAVEHARSVKSADEIACILASITVAEAGIARMREALRPGITELQLHAVLAHCNAEAGGEWFEYRFLSSGGRTNPWGQEASDKPIRAGELVAFDTGMVGPFGYTADVSRTIRCGPGRPTDEQRRLYSLAHENVHRNLELIRPGLSFREFSERGFRLPDEFQKRRYPMPVHGIGMTDEWPLIPFFDRWNEQGLDGEFRPGMTVCVESYVGSEFGVEGVKLEEQILITETGWQRLSTFPYEDELLG